MSFSLAFSAAIHTLCDETLGIIGVTLRMAFVSTAVGSALGIVLGLLLEKAEFPGKRAVVRLCRTLMGTPPVVVGLVVYLLLMRRGPLGFLGLLFTVPGMVIAQTLIITPIVCGMVYSYACRFAPQIRAFAKIMGANAAQTRILMIREMSSEIYFVVITGFGRAISEVGSVMIVGGNIQHKTRTMTTAISLMRNMGSYGEAITLGILLLIIAFLLQSFSDFLRKESMEMENF
ncbi:tungstate ABC transporter permease [Spirochaetia bacterium]|nr:tungstate ABC transporter permease [Spirochaetia bacterium]